ncbi:MAG: DUF4358 domain-containing protein [Firmicutes bacterium]|nr:DUF4358 domain-containing protein [Bacillota bacterium]
MKQKKSIFIILLLCMLLLQGILMTGCDSKNNDAACIDIVKACSNIAKNGSFDTYAGYGEEIYDDSFDGMYGVQYDMINDGAICYTASGGGADEISVLHLKEQGDISLAKQKMEDRIATRRNTFEGYMPEEVSKIDEARVIVQGNFIVLLISDDNDAMETEIRRIISEGKK